jgi:hypothetical protein
MTADADEVWTITAAYAGHLTKPGRVARNAIRDALATQAGHGFITAPSIATRGNLTTWSFRAGSQDPVGILAALVDTLTALAPPGWLIGTVRPGPAGE